MLICGDNMKKDNTKVIPASLNWVNYKAKDLKAIPVKIKKLLEDYKKNVLKIKKEDLTFSNLIHFGEDISANIARLDGVLFPFSNLHTDKKLRDESMKAELVLSKILNEFAYDEQMYQQFLNYYNHNFKTEKNKLNEEQIKVVEDSKKSYDKMGMHLSKKDKKILLDKKNKIAKLAQEFDKNATKNYEEGLFFTKDELKGVPEDYLKSFKYDDKKKKYFVNCSGRDDLGTDYPIVKKYCVIPKTRLLITIKNEEGVGEKNNKRLRDILKLREDIRKMLGFKTWGDLAMNDEMLKEPSEAKEFLENLIKSLKPDFLKSVKKLENVLKENNEKLSTSSHAFGLNLLKQKEISVLEEEYKPYFELETVLNVMFKTWENLFDIKTEVLPKQKVFHNDTKVLKFTDTQSGELLGHGVFDLHPRVGKYGHACVADIFKKYTNVNGDKHGSFTFMICNFKKSLQGPTFITLSDMNTLYHEAGHMLHMILMKNNYLSTSHTSRDFVEIPSQFHENFLLNEDFVLENFKHFETGEKMPENLVKNIKKINTRGENYSWIRTSTSSLFDQEIHGKNILKYAKNKGAIDKLYENLWNKNVVIKVVNKNRHHPSKWGHLVGGYDARYYSYVISKVYSVDFWHEFAKGGVKKNEMAKKYKNFLESANKKEEKVLVQEYLGRKVNQKPFLDLLN